MQQKSELLLIGFYGLGMSTVDESSVAHQEMREVSALSCHKNLTE